MADEKNRQPEDLPGKMQDAAADPGQSHEAAERGSDGAAVGNTIYLDKDQQPGEPPAITIGDLDGLILDDHGASANIEEILKQSRATKDEMREHLIQSGATIQRQLQENAEILAKMRIAGSGLDAVADVSKNLQRIGKSIAGIVERAQAYIQSDITATIQGVFDNIVAASAAAMQPFADVDEDLFPYLEAEFEKPEYADKTISELFDEIATDENGNPLEITLFEKALAAAKTARNIAAAKEEPPHAAIKRAQIVEYPLDKPNSIIWNLLEQDTKGQIEFNMARYGSRQKLPVYYSINFDGLDKEIQITKRLQPFDKLAYIAVAALFNAGNNVITLSQIYYAMGYTGTPGEKDRAKINDSITKMTTARIFFDNKQEAEKYKYARFKYDGSLLPLERGTAIVNGQVADAAIHIFREPPLITFAKQRKQITTLDIKLLQAPVSKTDANLQIQDYLLERISTAKARNGNKRSCRILFKTLYDHTGITTKKQAQRAPDKIKRYLTHYQKEGFITKFTTEKDGITVHW